MYVLPDSIRVEIQVQHVFTAQAKPGPAVEQHKISCCSSNCWWAESVLGPSFGQVMDCSYLECWIVSCFQCIAALGRDGPGDGRYYFRPLRQARAIDLAEQLTMAFKPTHLEAYFILKYQRNL